MSLRYVTPKEEQVVRQALILWCFPAQVFKENNEESQRVNPNFPQIHTTTREIEDKLLFQGIPQGMIALQ